MTTTLLTLFLLPAALAADPSADGDAAAAPAATEASPSSDDGFHLGSTGELRLLGSLPPDYLVDDEGHMVGQGPVLDTRLRAGLHLDRGSWRVATEWDLFEGQAVGDPWDIRGTEDARHRDVVDVLRGDAFQARELAMSGMVGKINLEAGLMTSHWGLGMVANDGSRDPVFGRNDFGDRVIRLQLATRPFKGGQTPLTLVLAGDRVVEDGIAEWSPLSGGDSAWQGIASAIWSKKPGQVLGVYAVYRDQTESDGERTTRAGVVDVYVDQPATAGDWQLRAAAEVAGIFGRTTTAQSYNSRDGLGVQSAGLTALLSATPSSGRTRGMLRGGWASGDGDPDDASSHDFTFNRDFDAGMVLFDEVQGALDAATYAQLTDPAHSGGAPEGADALVAEGAFRHAAFAQPVLGARPLDWLDAQAGVMFAWSTSPIGQAYQTYRNGGVPANHLGQPTSGHYLGTEIDWALKLGDVDIDTASVTTRPALLLQGGHLLASKSLGVGNVTLLTATARLRW